MPGSPEIERFETAMELCELAEELVRAKVQRTHPDLPTEEVEARVDRWFLQRDGAPQGDAEGRLASWPRGPRDSRPSKSG